MIVEEEFVMDAIYCVPMPPSLRENQKDAQRER